jgi:outer membrane protein
MKLMRTLIPLFLLLAFFVMPGATPIARAQTKIATVDLRKLMNGYWKTKQANVVLDNRKADLRKELKDMADGLEKAESDYKQLLTQADDPAISDVERDRRKQAVSDKDKEISDSKTAYDQFSRQAEVQLQDQVQRMTSNLLADIQAAVSAKAKLAGYSLVINSASDAVVFNSPDTDITADVLAELNAGAPIDVNAPATNDATTPALSTPPPGNP